MTDEKIVKKKTIEAIAKKKPDDTAKINAKDTAKVKAKNTIAIKKTVKAKTKDTAKVKKASRKEFKDRFLWMLNFEVSNDTAQNINEKTSELWKKLQGENVSDYLVFAQIIKALNGDAKAFEVIRDAIGEKPKDRQENGFADIEIVVQNATS